MFIIYIHITTPLVFSFLVLFTLTRLRRVSSGFAAVLSLFCFGDVLLQMALGLLLPLLLIGMVQLTVLIYLQLYDLQLRWCSRAGVRSVILYGVFTLILLLVSACIGSQS